jgi:hypothetical protein
VAARDLGDLALGKMSIAEAFQPIAEGVRSAVEGVDALILLAFASGVARRKQP